MNSEETARALSTEPGRVSILRRLLARMRRYDQDVEPLGLAALAPSLDELPVAQPVTCYLPQHVFEEMQRGFRFARYVYPSVEDWLELHILPEQRAMTLVEVEVRLRRVVPPR